MMPQSVHVTSCLHTPSSRLRSLALDVMLSRALGSSVHGASAAAARARALVRPHAELVSAALSRAPRMRCASSSSTAFYRPLPEPNVAWRATPEEVAEARDVARARNAAFNEEEAQELLRLHAEMTARNRQIADLEAEQRAVGERVPQLGKAAKSDSNAAAELESARERARVLRTELRELGHANNAAHSRSLTIRSAWPNRMHPNVPRGAEDTSTVVRVCDMRAAAQRSALPKLALPCTLAQLEENAELTAALPRGAEHDHLAVAQKLTHGGVDLSAGITATGPSWPYLLGQLSLLEHALSQYAIASTLRHGFCPVSVPDVIKTDIAERCGFRPRDEAASQTYFASPSRGDAEAPLCLAGTAEIPLAALVAKQTFAVQQDAVGNAGAEIARMQLPLKLAALGHAFRAEAGARGADTRGLYRIHQFSKVEMFLVTEDGAQSDAALEQLRAIQEEVVGNLGLLFRVLDMSSEELGASAYRKYDIEAWMPGRGAWGEVSSASNCTDYQSHRLAIKYRPPPASDGTQSRLRYAHTLNATAAAIPRLVLALLETYGTENGALVLPSTLRAFWPAGNDANVRWVDVGSAGRGPPAAPAAPSGTRGLHTSAVRRDVPRGASALSRAVEQMRSIAARTGADPASLVAAFLVLHELTALVPLLVLAVAFAALGVGPATLDALERAVAAVTPAPDDASSRSIRDEINARFSDGIAHGERVARRLAKRWGYAVEDAHIEQSGTRVEAVGALANVAAAYVIVKVGMHICDYLTDGSYFSQCALQLPSHWPQPLRARFSGLCGAGFGGVPGHKGAGLQAPVANAVKACVPSCSN